MQHPETGWSFDIDSEDETLVDEGGQPVDEVLAELLL
jgi:hypothetical protein